MHSILRIVDDHMKNNNIAISRVAFSTKYFPIELDRAILHEIRYFKEGAFDSYSPEITISKDRNGVIYMMAQDISKRKNLLIIEDYQYIDVPFVIKRVVKESELIRNSCMLKYVEKYMQRVRIRINEKYPDLSERNRKLKEYEILKETLKKAQKQLEANNKDIFDIVKCDNLIVESAKRINRYIDYLDDYYKKDRKQYERNRSR